MLPGLKVGHAHCSIARTGVTLLIPDQPVVMAVDVRGGGPGTRETEALDPVNLVERVHGLVLAGGSVFGLAAADEVALCLARQGRGLAFGEEADRLTIPVVPAAILFDLMNGGDKSWARADEKDPPYRRLAREAWSNLKDEPEAGQVGAGYGARAGSRQGGVGIAHTRLESGEEVAALIAVNSFGEVEQGEPPFTGPMPMPKRNGVAENTCIGAIVTNAPLSRPAARRVAIMAHDGLARSIRPIHTPFDGDTIFALSLASETPAMVDPLLLAQIGTAAADCMVRAVRQAVGFRREDD